MSCYASGLRYYEEIVWKAERAGVGKRVLSMLGGGPFYDLDGVVDYWSEEDVSWDMLTLPFVEPPRRSGPVVADYKLPASLLEEARNEGGYPDYEYVGGTFGAVSRVDPNVRAARRETLDAWAASSPGMATAYGAVLVAGGGQYDWMYAVGDSGEPLGLAELNAPGLDLRQAPPAERELLESVGMAMLSPFLLGFALLACENVFEEPSLPSGTATGGPDYLRPVVRTLARSRAGGQASGDAQRWELLPADTRPRGGHFRSLGDGDGLPSGCGAGLYWIAAEG